MKNTDSKEESLSSLACYQLKEAEALFLNLSSLRKTLPVPSRLSNVSKNIICHIPPLKQMDIYFLLASKWCSFSPSIVNQWVQMDYVWFEVYGYLAHSLDAR